MPGPNPYRHGTPTRVITRTYPCPPSLPVNPSPLAGTRRSKPGFERARRCAPNMLLKGLAKRPHCSGGKVPGGHFAAGHNHNETYTKLVPLSKTYKKNKQ